MRIALASSALALAALTGCVNYTVKNDGIARAALSETVSVDGPKVTPLEVLEDSRCPKDTQCVWAGRVRISAAIALGQGTQTRELILGQPNQVADGQLTLVEVQPEAKSGRNVYPEEYRFGFTFAGGL